MSGDPLSWMMVLKLLVLIGVALCSAELWHSHAIATFLKATQDAQAITKLDAASSNITQQLRIGLQQPFSQEQEEAQNKRDPMIHFITYGDDHYTNSKARITEEAQSTNWFETVRAYGPSDLPKGFRSKFSDILGEGRGGGYWVWKYALLEEALARVPKGDIVIYLDAGCQVNPKGEKRFREYIQMIQDSPSYDIISFQMDGQDEHWWTTEKIFQAFDIEPNNNDIRRSGQLVGGILLVQNGRHARKWLDLVWKVLEKDQWLASDRYNEEAKAVDPEFNDNRHDQSISSVSRKLIGSIYLKDETYPILPGFPFYAARIQG